jgi:folate-binding protein YgfZ
MGVRQFVELQQRGVIGVSGGDARDFLQGLITNDMGRVSADRAIYAALLTPQGKFLHDFFITQAGEQRFFLDCDGERLMELGQRLATYKLRAAVEIADLRDEWQIAALIGRDSAAAVGLTEDTGACGAVAGGYACVDPRHAGLGVRSCLPRGTARGLLLDAGFAAGDFADYEHLRLSLGVPDGSRDIAAEKATLAEAGFEALNGVDFDKGCYVGQEVTTRMKHRGTARKRLLPLRLLGDTPPPGTPVLAGDREIGETRSASGDLALALFRVDRLEDAGDEPLSVGGQPASLVQSL